MPYLELAPPPPLDRVVHCFWFVTGEHDGTEPEPVVPDGRMELILHLGEPFGLLNGRGPAEPQQPLPIAGQLTRPIRLLPLGHADAVGIRFRTVGAGSLVGVSLSELADQVDSLVDVAPGLAQAFLNAVAGRIGPANLP